MGINGVKEECYSKKKLILILFAFGGHWYLGIVGNPGSIFAGQDDTKKTEDKLFPFILFLHSKESISNDKEVEQTFYRHVLKWLNEEWVKREDWEELCNRVVGKVPTSPFNEGTCRLYRPIGMHKPEFYGKLSRLNAN